MTREEFNLYINNIVGHGVCCDCGVKCSSDRWIISGCEGFKVSDDAWERHGKVIKEGLL